MKILVRLIGRKFLKARRLIFILITKRLRFAKNWKKTKEMQSASGHLMTLFNITKDKHTGVRMSQR